MPSQSQRYGGVNARVYVTGLTPPAFMDQALLGRRDAGEDVRPSFPLVQIDRDFYSMDRRPQSRPL